VSAASPIRDTAQVDLEERAHRLRRIARVLRHDLENHPPEDEEVAGRAWLRVKRHEAEAAEFEAKLKIETERGY
jgi:hypothetical protein